MNPKTLLSKHYSLGRRIMWAERDIAQLRELATAIGSFDYSKDRVKSSLPQGARYERIVEEIADKREKLEADIERWLSERDQIETFIDWVEDERQREVLYMRYILHMKYELIAKELHYSIDNVFYLHRKGLSNINSKFHMEM